MNGGSLWEVGILLEPKVLLGEVVRIIHVEVLPLECDVEGVLKRAILAAQT